MFYPGTGCSALGPVYFTRSPSVLPGFPGLRTCYFRYGDSADRFQGIRIFYWGARISDLCIFDAGLRPMRFTRRLLFSTRCLFSGVRPGDLTRGPVYFTRTPWYFIRFPGILPMARGIYPRNASLLFSTRCLFSGVRPGIFSGPPGILTGAPGILPGRRAFYPAPMAFYPGPLVFYPGQASLIFSTRILFPGVRPGISPGPPGILSGRAFYLGPRAFYPVLLAFYPWRWPKKAPRRK